eukprot:gnl/Chilomastix_cuspidata/2944.p1 GENE.gnl/Chilomastix_cuspidata/2944~~gnl/Chilomastix_cuspidata/2944.p1  ORF type:complete len:1361 (+),score=347.10 gnl/Chilomastix_cuspidata/2944:42-4124(+)
MSIQRLLKIPTPLSGSSIRHTLLHPYAPKLYFSSGRKIFEFCLYQRQVVKAYFSDRRSPVINFHFSHSGSETFLCCLHEDGSCAQFDVDTGTCLLRSKGSSLDARKEESFAAAAFAFSTSVAPGSAGAFFVSVPSFGGVVAVFPKSSFHRQKKTRTRRYVAPAPGAGAPSPASCVVVSDSLLVFAQENGAISFFPARQDKPGRVAPALATTLARLGITPPQPPHGAPLSFVSDATFVTARVLLLVLSSGELVTMDIAPLLEALRPDGDDGAAAAAALGSSPPANTATPKWTCHRLPREETLNLGHSRPKIFPLSHDDSSHTFPFICASETIGAWLLCFDELSHDVERTLLCGPMLPPHAQKHATHISVSQAGACLVMPGPKGAGTPPISGDSIPPQPPIWASKVRSDTGVVGAPYPPLPRPRRSVFEIHSLFSLRLPLWRFPCVDAGTLWHVSLSASSELAVVQEDTLVLQHISGTARAAIAFNPNSDVFAWSGDRVLVSKDRELFTLDARASATPVLRATFHKKIHSMSFGSGGMLLVGCVGFVYQIEAATALGAPEAPEQIQVNDLEKVRLLSGEVPAHIRFSSSGKRVIVCSRKRMLRLSSKRLDVLSVTFYSSAVPPISSYMSNSKSIVLSLAQLPGEEFVASTATSFLLITKQGQLRVFPSPVLASALIHFQDTELTADVLPLSSFDPRFCAAGFNKSASELPASVCNTFSQFFVLAEKPNDILAQISSPGVLAQALASTVDASFRPSGKALVSALFTVAKGSPTAALLLAASYGREDIVQRIVHDARLYSQVSLDVKEALALHQTLRGDNFSLPPPKSCHDAAKAGEILFSLSKSRNHEEWLDGMKELTKSRSLPIELAKQQAERCVAAENFIRISRKSQSVQPPSLADLYTRFTITALQAPRAAPPPTVAAFSGTFAREVEALPIDEDEHKKLISDFSRASSRPSSVKAVVEDFLPEYSRESSRLEAIAATPHMTVPTVHADGPAPSGGFSSDDTDDSFFSSDSSTDSAASEDWGERRRAFNFAIKIRDKPADNPPEFTETPIFLSNQCSLPPQQGAGTPEAEAPPSPAPPSPPKRHVVIVAQAPPAPAPPPAPEAPAAPPAAKAPEMSELARLIEEKSLNQPKETQSLLHVALQNKALALDTVARLQRVWTHCGLKARAMDIVLRKKRYAKGSKEFLRLSAQAAALFLAASQIDSIPHKLKTHSLAISALQFIHAGNQAAGANIARLVLSQGVEGLTPVLAQSIHRVADIGAAGAPLSEGSFPLGAMLPTRPCFACGAMTMELRLGKCTSCGAKINFCSQTFQPVLSSAYTQCSRCRAFLTQGAPPGGHCHICGEAFPQDLSAFDVAMLLDM